EWLKLKIWRNGKMHQMEFRHGVAVAPLEVGGTTDRRGTEVHFMAATETFGRIEFHYEILARRIRELSFLNNGVKIELVDQRDGKSENFAYSGGIKGFVDMYKFSAEVSPLRHATLIDEVGDTCAFLVSNLSRGVTGHILYVDSGYHILGMPTRE
ncbi:MAG: SDR family oxidoreductase, partial [bacterium]